MSRPRVVILGGGMAGLVTAWELSSDGWQDRFESITLYQRGWRLGGKGASSRGDNDRIEEHGLHVLLGYYDATFRVLREVYGELDRPRSDPRCPIPTWRDAFSPAPEVGLAELNAGKWSTFVTRFSTNTQLPGEPGAEDRPLSVSEIAARSLRLLFDFFEAVGTEPPPGIYLSASPNPRPRPVVPHLLRGAAVAALAAALEGLERASRRGATLGVGSLRELAPLVLSLRDAARAEWSQDPAARRIWQLMDLVVTNLAGMLVDGLVGPDRFASIDHLDYREWLAGHGAAPETVDSPIVRGMYDLTFAYEEGDRTRPRFAAGLGLQLASRMLFDFKGSLFWRMEVGMGEAVFAPLYQALRRRGVEFRFFHRLDHLSLGDAASVRSIHLTRQADLTGGRHEYEPLIRVGGLPCWPKSPHPDQVAVDPNADLERHDRSGAEASRVELVAGRDFDVAVLAVSLGMIPLVASELVAADRRWRDMVDRVGTVATRSAQLWMTATEDELGWGGPDGVTLSGLGDSFDTWASMSHLLHREGWNGAAGPRSLAYLCGALEEGGSETEVEASLKRFLEKEAPALWPNSHSPDGFRWELLWDGSNRTGSDRLEAQYRSANTDPSDRYVQSLPGSGAYRLAPGDTGFDNLVVAGDWTACGLDAGCLEAATRSGILAGRAITGRLARQGPG